MPVNNNPGQPGWKPANSVKLPIKPNGQRGRIDFDPVKFQEFIDQKGVRVKVYRTMLCPRVASIDGAEHDIECPLCFGAQFVDTFPITTMVMFQSELLQKSNLAEGLFDKDVVSATFQIGIELQYFAMVELVDFPDTYYQRVKRQRGQLDILRYPATEVNSLMDYSGKLYYSGNDFTLDPNGSIVWFPNKGPENGQVYSVNYKFKKRFRAIKALHANRYTQLLNKAIGQIEMIKLPDQWILQVDYLVERKDQFGKPLATNLIRDEDDPNS